MYIYLIFTNTDVLLDPKVVNDQSLWITL